MKKVIDGSKIEFLIEESDEVIMYMDYFADECVWFFKDSNEVIITDDMELFEPLKELMEQQYNFSSDDVFKCYKKGNELVWYSDCYCNPNDEWDIKSVSYLTITCESNYIKLKCTKPLDMEVPRKSKTHVIAFSPSFNGRFARNINTGSTLQDDFISKVYQALLDKEIIRELHQ